jgi:serine/threonine protein kinase
VFPRASTAVDSAVALDEPTSRPPYVGPTPGRSAVDVLPRSPDPPRLTPDQVQALFPTVGNQFLGFHLIAELGRGASGRVYLARQGDLADRQVALKVTAAEFDEPLALAQLQHTNVVPIHSAHRAGPLCALCMPYFGPTTLGDVIRGLTDFPGVPNSGRDLLGTLYDRRSEPPRSAQRPAEADSDTTRPNRHRPSVHAGPAADPPPPPISASKATSILKMLESLEFVDACLWIGSRLADGLAHAHDRGILHLDLKPANVLLTDEGQPMLLDFNMARDTKRRTNDDAVGGTFPYMAPEHLEAFAGDKVGVDGRADIFSLGVILYELLTRRRPYPAAAGRPTDELIAARRAGPPLLRPLNRAVTPAVESIIHKCLAPDPARRYQAAQELSDDLRLQLAHQPLRYAPEPSFRERAKKWVHRNPKLASWTMALAVTVGTMIALAGWAAVRGR